MLSLALAGLSFLLGLSCLSGLYVLAAGTASAAENPQVELSRSQAGTGGSITVRGSGWRADALLTILVCGRSSTDRGVIGGTDSCANADGRAATTDARGRFSRRLPVTEPPQPCPCVVHVATVTGAKAAADAPFLVAGHEVEPLPKQDSAERLSVLGDTRLDGSSGLLTWFGAPPSRDLVLTVGNVGTVAVKNPVFQVGTSHGVFAPQWEEHRWRGTIGPGKKARVTLPVELTAGAHGDYTVSLKSGGKVLAEQPWGVGRPWGVTFFWVLVCVVVPAAVFRAGMAVVDRMRPNGPPVRSRSGRDGRDGRVGRTERVGRPGRGAHGVRRGRVRLPDGVARMFDGVVRTRRPGSSPAASAAESGGAASAGAGAGSRASGRTGSVLPWFTPDTDPGGGEGERPSGRPHENTSTGAVGKGDA
ncbi:hypothetical protein [Streptomyces sp. V3I8]|uniref:hypothetical protein n=1 Tax=Streptomyces sp. V3I8 TaxID=3042279 RepID=UPI0027D86D0A|nr:hypothetical protein [Streptomyces sp. V3I8]